MTFEEFTNNVIQCKESKEIKQQLEDGEGESND